jgi:ABC-2 type transport system ATP-binding protein
MNEPLLQVRTLSAAYGIRRVLHGIDLEISRGEWFSLLGPNGSGKSTLLRCVSGQVTPTSGTVLIGGASVSTAPRDAKRLLGYAHPPERLPGLLTGQQCLEIYAAARDLPAIDAEVLDLAEDFRLRPFLNQFVDSYSLGTRQKLSALLALLGNPSLIVLDEAFNGLDPASSLVLKHHLQERIRSGRCAVLLATHALDTVLSYSSRAGLLLEGGLARTWSRVELDSMRAGDPGALEVAMAQAASASRPGDLPANIDTRAYG